mmetsp:Transcript_24730/g.34543  ORF Transcript_24730/g.34543 Transcript_24730/m.34543 type:complete len:217 (+) Transcript_24730:1035-1685(+)
MAELSLLLLLRELLAHVLEGSHRQVELLSGVLSEVSQLESLHGVHNTGSRSQATSKKLEESGFSSSIRSHNAHTSSSGDGAVGLLPEDEDVSSRVLEGDILHVDQGNVIRLSLWVDALEWCRIREGEHVALSKLPPGVGAAPCPILSHSFTHWSRWVRIPVAADELLAVAVLLSVLTSLLLLEGREIHFVVNELPVLDQDDGVTDVLKEISVVSHK